MKKIFFDNKKTIIGLILIMFMFLISIKPVLAAGGVSAGSLATSAGNQTTNCSQWPGQNIGESLRALRITVVDSSGNPRSGSKSIDYARRNDYGDLVFYTTTKRSTKTYYLNNNVEVVFDDKVKKVNFNNNEGTFRYNETLAKNLIPKFGSDTENGLISGKIKNLYNNYISYIQGGRENAHNTAYNIIKLIYKNAYGKEKFTSDLIKSGDVLLFEPVTEVQLCFSGDYYFWSGRHIYGTTYELNSIYKGPVKNAGAGTVVRMYLPKTLYFSGNKISPLTDNYPETTAMDYTLSDKGVPKNVTSKNGWGMGAMWVSEPGLGCDINKNNNSNSKYNWTSFDATCDLDGDGKAEGCWKKINGGCCDTAVGKYTAEQIAKKYAQCAEDICKLKNSQPSNDVKQCANSGITLSNELHQSATGLESIPGYCYATNGYYAYTRGTYRVGCVSYDKLNLPARNNDLLSSGDYIVWPTSSNTIKMGLSNNNDYPITRISQVNCMIYSINENGVFTRYSKAASNTFYDNAVNRMKKTIKGDITLVYNGKNNGNLEIEEQEVKNLKNENGAMKFRITSYYSLPKVSDGQSNVYAYYDRQEDKYINYLPDSSDRFKQYGIPIIPLGNPSDKEEVTVNYGLELKNIKFWKMKDYSCTFNCDKQAVPVPQKECVCPAGTDLEGTDLESKITDYNNYEGECNILQKNECDIKNVKCPVDTDNEGTDITECVETNKYNAQSPDTPYGVCVVEECYDDGVIEEPIPDPDVPNMCPDWTGKPDISIEDCVIEKQNDGLSEDMAKFQCIKEDCTDEKKKTIIYRTIFLDNPFPSINGQINGTKREPGGNWKGSTSDINYFVRKYITDDADKVYQGKPMYRFELKPEVIKNIKSYNEKIGKGYDDFNLTNNEEESEYWISSFLRGDILGSAFTGGTCRNASDAKIKNDELKDCRTTALKS